MKSASSCVEGTHRCALSNAICSWRAYTVKVREGGGAWRETGRREDEESRITERLGIIELCCNKSIQKKEKVETIFLKQAIQKKMPELECIYWKQIEFREKIDEIEKFSENLHEK